MKTETKAPITNDQRRLAEIILKLTGHRLEDDKIYLLNTRLRDLMREYNLESFEQTVHKLERNNDPEFVERIIDNITTHETRFFRDESIFSALVEQIIPEWLERQGLSRISSERLNIWCVGCSTGQEPYSIKMIINEKLPHLSDAVTILATDISLHSLQRAESGTYSKFEVERGVPERFLTKYFRPDGANFKIIDELKKNITYKKHNLIADVYPGNFDVIFCRNVAIYFIGDARRGVYEKLKNSLKSDGALILGSSENLIGSLSGYIIREFGLARYYEFASQVTFF